MKDQWVNKCGYDNSAISLMRKVQFIKEIFCTSFAKGSFGLLFLDDKHYFRYGSLGAEAFWCVVWL